MPPQRPRHPVNPPAKPVRRRSLLAGGAGLIVGGAGLIAAASWRGLAAAKSKPVPPSASASPPASPAGFDLARLDGSQLVAIDADGWHGWALIDHENGSIVGSKTFSENSRTCSTIKVWIAADFLRRAAENKQTPSDAKLALVSKMIRDSHNGAASDLFSELGEKDSLERMNQMCGLTDFTPGDSWGYCEMSPRDMVRMAASVAGGVAAGPKWTEWLLNEMRLVRIGTWGIREAFPQAQAAKLSIKNGWDTTQAKKTLHANCMAITPRWSMMVLTRYAIDHKDGYRHGQVICRDVAAQLLKAKELEPLFTKQAAPSP